MVTLGFDLANLRIDEAFFTTIASNTDFSLVLG